MTGTHPAFFFATVTRPPRGSHGLWLSSVRVDHADSFHGLLPILHSTLNPSAGRVRISRKRIGAVRSLPWKGHASDMASHEPPKVVMTSINNETQVGAAIPQALVVEDSDDLRQLFCTMLGALGFAATGASNADEALALLHTAGPFDLLLTDVNMPGTIDGSVLAAMARRLFERLLIIVVTAEPGQALAELPHDVTVLAKPFYLRELAAEIDRSKAR
ncbi:response regulator [Dyella jiangningensis]